MSRRFWIWFSASFFVAMIAAFTSVLAPILQPRRRGLHPNCLNNMRQIAIALQSYLATTGEFPPAYTVDENGRPLHSWRTLLLPALDQAPLLKKIDRTKPWNDPVNLPFHEIDLPFFRCPDADIQKSYTTYQILVGQDALLLPTEPRQDADITAPHDTILMLIEVSSDKAVHWMDPTDHAVDYLSAPGPLKNTAHAAGINAIYLSGRGAFLSSETPLETRQALISITQDKKPNVE